MAVRNQTLALLLILAAVGTVVGVALLNAGGQGSELQRSVALPVLMERPEQGALEGVAGPDQPPAVDDVDTEPGRTQAAFGGREALLPGRLVERGTAMAIAGGHVLASFGEVTRGAISSEAGTFEISLPEGLEGSFRVSHPEYVDLYAPQLPVPTTEEWVIAMEPAGSISGRLVGPGAGSRGEATVHLWRWGSGRLEDESMAMQAVLDGGGFEFANLPTGVYTVGAIMEGTPPVLQSGVQVERGRRTDVLVSMPLGASFTALVETRGQGGPVQGAQVELEPTLVGRGNPLEELTSMEVLTEANGRAPFTGLNSGTHRVHIRTPWGDELTEQVEISPHSRTSEKRFLFSPPARLSGRVVDSQGQGVADSEVRCLQPRERSWYSSQEGGEVGVAVTDDAGNFEFERVPARSSFTVTAWTQGGFALSDSIRLQSGESRAGLILRLGEGFEVRGVVRDSDGLPLAGVTVEGVVRWKDQELDRRLTISHETGEFVLHGLPAGRCRLTAELEGYSPGTLDKTVEQNIEGLEIRVQPAHFLEGVVLDPDGWGISGARVRARVSASRRSRSRYATADEYGRFMLEGLYPGSWSLGASAPGFPARDESKVNVEVPFAGRVELQLTPEIETAPCVLTGEIVMKGSGNPVKGLRFHGYRYQTISLDGTRFEITGPPVKKLTLSATGSNAETLTFPMVHLASGDRIDLGRAETRHTWGVKVQVRDGSGRLLTGADVWLQRKPDQKIAEYVVVPKTIRLRGGRNGEYSTSQAGTYEWVLVVRHSAWNSHKSTVRVSADSTSFEVRLTEPRRRGGNDQ